VTEALHLEVARTTKIRRTSLNWTEIKELRKRVPNEYFDQLCAIDRERLMGDPIDSKPLVAPAQAGAHCFTHYRTWALAPTLLASACSFALMQTNQKSSTHSWVLRTYLRAPTENGRHLNSPAAQTENAS
jgi:hypothetical protein